MVEKSQEIAHKENLSVDDIEDVYYAAWLHDVGYWEGKAAGHELIGARFAAHHLPEWGIDRSRIDRIKAAILATQVPQSPKTKMEAALCDADMYHLSMPDFIDSSLILKREIENLLSVKWPILDWLKNSKKFTQEHVYHTDFGKEVLEPRKQNNLQVLEERIQKLESKDGLI